MMWGGVAGNVAGAEESKEEGKKRVLFLPVVRACEANFTAIKVSQGGRVVVTEEEEEVCRVVRVMSVR